MTLARHESYALPLDAFPPLSAEQERRRRLELEGRLLEVVSVLERRAACGVGDFDVLHLVRAVLVAE